MGDKESWYIQRPGQLLGSCRESAGAWKYEGAEPWDLGVQALGLHLQVQSSKELTHNEDWRMLWNGL